MYTGAIPLILASSYLPNLKQAAPDAADTPPTEVEICDPENGQRVSLTSIIQTVYTQLIAEMDDSGDTRVNHAFAPIANILRPINDKLVGPDGNGGALGNLRNNYPDFYVRYQQIESEVIMSACSSENPSRVSLTYIVQTVYQKLMQEMDDGGDARINQAFAPIANILRPINDKLVGPDGNGGALGKLGNDYPDLYTRYQELEAIRIRTEQCGCQMIPVPTITGITPTSVTLDEQAAAQPASSQKQATQGQEFQFTITGTNFPTDVGVEFLLGNNADSSITIKDGTLQVSPNGTTITMIIIVDPSAPADDPATQEVENQRTIRVVGTAHDQLSAILPNALTILVPADLTQCSDRTDNDGDGLTDFTTGPNRDPGCANADDNNEIDPDPTCKNHIDDDRDGLVDMNDPDCVNGTSEPVAPPPTPTPIEHYLLEHQLAASILLGGGYYGNIPTNLRAGAETLGTPVALDINFGDEAHPITIIGQKNALGGNPVEWLELMGYAMFGYQYFMHLNGAEDTHQVDLAAGLHPRAHIGPVFLDVYGGVNYQHNNYQYPNLLFYDGNNILGNVGVGIGSSFGTQGDWITAVLRGEYQNEWFDYSDFMFRGNPMSYPFRGNSQAGELGVDLTMAFADRYCAETGTCWYPNLDMDLSFVLAPNGTIRTPGFIASTYGVTQDDLFGSEFAVALRFARGKYQPYASLSVSTLDLGIENDPEFWQMAFAAGANFEGHELALQLGGGQGWRRNLAVYGEGDLFFTTLSYTPPMLGGALSVTGRLDVVDGQVGGGGGFLGFDFAKLGYWLYQRNHPQSSQ